MADISPSSIASGLGVGVKNTQFIASASVLSRKILILGTYDPLLTVTENTPQIVLSANDVGARYGFGTMIHRLAMRAFDGSQGVETHVSVQDEAVAAVAATGSILFAGTSTGSGTLPVYIAGDRVAITVPKAQTPAQRATALVAAITSLRDLPVTAAVNGVTPELVDITAKSKGPWGNKITIEIALNGGEVDGLPAGTTTTITDMASGAGIPSIATALTNLGSGDSQNELHFTDVIHGYGQDTTTLDALSVYNGEGNDYTGNYSKLVARPFRSLVGDTVSGSAGLSALLVVSAGRKLDRTNGIVPAPGSPNHPDEIAAWCVGYSASVASVRAEENVNDRPTPFFPGASADRWTNDRANREIAIQAGIGSTGYANGVLVIKDLVTFYRPDSVPVSSNGYRSYRNISILQNVMNAVKENFAGERWKGFTVVADVGMISNTTSAQKARDIDAVIADYVALAQSMGAWLYSASFTINQLKLPGSVTVRLDGRGFDSILRIVLSGEGGILNNTIEFDINLSVFTR